MKYKIREEIPTSARKKLEDYPDLLAKLLYYRGISEKEESEKFLMSDYELGNHDPFLLKSMDKASDRVIRAISGNQKILIYSDYDADGIPGAIVLHDFFKKAGFNNFDVYIPHRHDEGFGLNHEAVEEAASGGVKLLITIDCGTADFEEVEKANRLGMEVIITDHHLPADENNLPKAFAVVNPKQMGDEYPFKDLCGAGVIFKLVQAILKKKNFGLKNGMEKWFLDMVGLATLADMVPLVGENRIFARYGLKVLKKSPRVGLMKLLRKLGIDQNNLTEDDLGFSVVPRINAASRMGIPRDAFLLLSTKSETEADVLSDHLNKINDERKGVVASIVKEAKKIISGWDEEKMLGKKVIVIGNPNWKPALAGLVANSLAEEYKKPAFVWGRNGDSTLKGSCRSEGGTNVFLLMQSAPEAFLDFGGHKMSGGFSVAHEKIHVLDSELEKAFSKLPACVEEEIFIDHKCAIDDVNWEISKSLEKLAPFGVGNPKPLFLFENARVYDVRSFGKENNHLEISFEKSDGNKVRAIGFFTNASSFGKEVKKGEKINLVATLEKSFFRGYPELRLRIEDVI